MWGRSIEKRRSLREAKNVVLNLELLCVEYYGREDMLFDDTRISGLSLLGEEEIRNTAEVKGEITMLVMDNVKQHVDGLNYRNEKYVVCYRSEPLEGEDKMGNVSPVAVNLFD